MSNVYFNESVILLDLDAGCKEEVLEAMSRNLVDLKLVKESFPPAIIRREEEYATGLPTAGVAVAIPHTDVEHVLRKTISVGVLKEAVEFGVMGDGEETIPVRIVFLLAMDEAHSQLSLLQQLMGVFQNEEILRLILEEKNKSGIRRLLEQKLAFDAIEGEKS
ncbi:PTS sugar transporter subunit IIA [Halobacillus sp. ACCC02827]|uniref:PTS sugar transporter subunit IIA n=1 Tax=Bacillaceae TaxID=186817 RepID=UPI0002A4D828|nr:MULTISPECIES: PTS sugar transporter subunit IIA [Bacillaceae]ELK47877.1 PTS system fructose-specific transsporter subunit IIBC [Halobacillus sp. BAB-2008]QHT45200.1 PTS sugar transporter subunit IIA [Bacillus sp. SB49]WJE15980.1 PTS sugar transporter subunit IIA [Halobacillus sp. ACCC02827]